MAVNPKSKENLKPIKKGELSKEEAKKRGSKGGKKSAEVRRAKKDSKESARYILELAAKGAIRDNLVNLGVEESERTNIVALQARLFAMAIGGNLEAYKELMKMAGYEPEENRKERESLSADRRRETELQAKCDALGSNAATSVSVSMNDEDSRNDVVIYLPEIMKEEDCELPPEKEEDK